MEIITHPPRADWEKITARPSADSTAILESVRAVLEDVRLNGDSAVARYTAQFDHAVLNTATVPCGEISAAEQLVPEPLKHAIHTAASHIETFHRSQQLITRKIETAPGITCWQKAVAIEKTGLYIPGGTAPLFSTVLMLAIPARIAGCKEIIMCTPPAANGSIHPAILYAAHISGVSRIFRAGGIQAIAAMAYGTETIPRVYKIFGPGNRYVTAAKQLVALRDVAIDMPAGPSEVLVLADSTAHPDFIAADMLSQAEHGTDSQAILVTTSKKTAEQTASEITRQLHTLPRKQLARQSLQHSRIIILENIRDAIAFTNTYAPEHLIIETDDSARTAEQITSAGSVFLGHFTPESAGDYASGTNHTLPTGGYARMYSGVNLDSFVKKITFQEISPAGILHTGPAIEIMAQAESLQAHSNAVTVRMRAAASLC